MNSQALNQLYGQTATGVQLYSFAHSLLTQYALSLFNRASSITEQFSLIYRRDEFIDSFLTLFANEKNDILFRQKEANFFLLDLENIWRLCEARLNAPGIDSPEATNALLEVGMSLVAHRASAGADRAHLILRLPGVEAKSWGICPNKQDGDIEVWEIGANEGQFLNYVTGAE